MSDNGLRNISAHNTDERFQETIATINDDMHAADAARAATFEAQKLDPESAARRHLNQIMARPAAFGVTPPEMSEESVEYKVIGTETVPLTRTTFVKFAQYYRRIPVYGSLITVELEEDNSLLSMRSAVGEPTEVDPVATISPAGAMATIRHDSGAETYAEPPKLFYYFDEQADHGRWRLVYIATNVRRTPSGEGTDGHLAGIPEFLDYVVDAHSGDVVARLSRTQSVTWTPDQARAVDDLGRLREFRLERDEDGNRRLSDTVRNVHTHNFGFQDLTQVGQELPGHFVLNPPEPWSTAGVSAHANAAVVADFVTSVLARDGLDNQGTPFVSSVNCTFAPTDPDRKIWQNAAWVGAMVQMVYGQRPVNGVLRSYALARDVVAHEIIHGLTDHTARLKYETESGALNESYSDIFGIIISNFDEPDVSRWNWELGEDLDVTGIPLRDLSDPARRGQPAHMRDFKPLPPGELPDARANDHGFVHKNSGIHNKAAHNMLTANNPDGSFTLTPVEVARLFGSALTRFLSRSSKFTDSRAAVELAAKSSFQDDPPVTRRAKLAAIAKAFDAVGVEDPNA
jgi:bacillolysin/neutral peptidase B